jgi:hypothetical protein
MLITSLPIFETRLSNFLQPTKGLPSHQRVRTSIPVGTALLLRRLSALAVTQHHTSAYVSVTLCRKISTNLICKYSLSAFIASFPCNFRRQINSVTYIITIIKSRRMRWAGHVARIGEKMNTYRLLVEKPDGKKTKTKVGG